MEKLSVVVSLITEQNDYQREQAASAQAAAEKLGASVQIIYANNDAVHQTQQILQFIQEPSKRPDGIVVEPVGTGMPQVAKAAVAAGIAWGVVNSRVDYLEDLRRRALVPVFSVLSDHEQIGRIQGQQIAAILGEEGCVLCIEGPGVGDVAKMRTKGMMASKPQRVSVKTLKGDWTQRSGYNAIRSWLGLSTSRELHIGMVACQNDDMAIGARHAFEEIGTQKSGIHGWLCRLQAATVCPNQGKPGCGKDVLQLRSIRLLSSETRSSCSRSHVWEELNQRKERWSRRVHSQLWTSLHGSVQRAPEFRQQFQAP